MVTDREDLALDRLFQAGRTGPQPSDDLMARIMADAAHRAAPVHAASRPGLLATLLSLVGGWPAAAGMATAAAAGVWLGFSSPDLVDGYVSGDSMALGDFMPDVSVVAEGS